MAAKQEIQEIDIKAITAIAAITEGSNTSITITPADSRNKHNFNIITVVDISGSMGTSASIATVKENHGLTTLDLAKHGLATIIAGMTEQDNLAIISFHTDIKTELPLSICNPVNKKKAVSVIKELEPQNSTNLYGGIHAALSTIPADSNAMSVLIVMTDGVESEIPPEGTINALNKWIVAAQKAGKVIPLIYIIGLGTNLESDKLIQIAGMFGGLFQYVHDAGSVGTVIVNMMANIYTIFAMQTNITLSNKKIISLGTLHTEQTKNIIIPTSELSGAILSFNQLGRGIVNINIEDIIQNATQGKILEYDIFRSRLCEIIKNAIQTYTYNLKSIKERFIPLLDELGNSSYLELFQDAIELLKALEYTQGWGLHFLRGMQQNHYYQICGHFKDIGTSRYTSPYRNTLVSKFNDIFNELPPPKPSIISQTTVAIQSMSVYNNSDDSCIDGSCSTILKDGSTVRIDSLSKGDILYNGATIICVIKTHTKDGHSNLVHIGNLRITQYHPVYVNNIWYFPSDLGEPVYTPCDYIYSFILDEQHVINIEGIDCVALGHGFTESKVQHNYFGTDAVIRDLSCMPGYDKGLLEFNSGCLIRSNTTGDNLVSGFNPSYLRM